MAGSLRELLFPALAVKQRVSWLLRARNYHRRISASCQEEYIADAQRLGLKLGLASSSDCPWVYRHLERLGLRERFDSIKCADDVENVKPSPDLYLAVLEELGLGPEEAIALEDSPNGITAAQAASLFCVVVPNALTQQLATDHADLHLSSLEEMPLEELLSRADKRR